MSDNLPEGWKWVTLKDVLDVRSEFVDPVNCSKMKFVGLEHLVSGQNSVSAFQVGAEMRSTKSRFYPRDILYGKLRPYLDKGGLVDFEGYCSTDILVFVPKQNKVISEYIANILHTPEFIQYSTKHTKGTNHPRTSWKALSNYEILLPPLPEQKRIAEILTTADEQITLAQKRKALLQQIKTGLMQNLLSGAGL